MLGIDIEENVRFKGWDDKKLNRIFTKKEIEYAKGRVNPEKHFCGFFCVKEALVKALDNKQIEYKKIEVLHTDTQKPYINETAYVKSLIGKTAHMLTISISHTATHSTAIVQIL